jgi:hypothetical protein
LNYGTGPNLDIWTCHGTDNIDYMNQRFVYNNSTKTIRPELSDSCLTLGRSQPLPDASSNDGDDPWDTSSAAHYIHRCGVHTPCILSILTTYSLYIHYRVKDLLRFLKSSGINTLVLNDVNACGAMNNRLLDTPWLANWTANLGPLFERYAITPMLSICFAGELTAPSAAIDPDPYTLSLLSFTLYTWNPTTSSHRDVQHYCW